MKKSKFLPIFLLLIAISTAVAYQVANNPFVREEPLDGPQGKYLLRWATDNPTRIVFNVTVETRGWVGFGLSLNGTIEAGADMVIGGVARTGGWNWNGNRFRYGRELAYFSDRHINPGSVIPNRDRSQDWTLLAARESETHTFLSFSRALDTCDEEDHLISLNKVTIIWEYGSEDDENGSHIANRGIYHVHLLDPDFAPEIRRSGDGTPTLITSGRNENIPPGDRTSLWSVRRTWDVQQENETSYICSIHKAPSLNRKHHVIGAAVHFPDEISERHTHHVVVTRCRPPRDVPAREFFEKSTADPGQPCYLVGGFRGPENLLFPNQFCTEFYYGWGIGGKPYFFPSHMGSPFGESEDEYYLIQMHYDNPNRLPGLRVEARVELFYTNELRPNDGIHTGLQHDLPGLPESILVPPNTPNHKILSHCSSECTQRMFPPEGITVSTVMLHSHNAGIAMRLRHFRRGRELPWILYDDNYDNKVQPSRNLRQEVRILPGDQLTLDCHLRSNRTVVGGFSTQQEMCLAVLVYYMANNQTRSYSLCVSGIQSPEARREFLGVENVTWVQENVLEWVADSPEAVRGRRISEISDTMVDWTPAKRRELQLFHEIQPQTGSCFRTVSGLSLAEFMLIPEGPPAVPMPGPVDTPVNWVGPVSYPYWAVPYVPPRRTCPGRRPRLF